MPKVLHLSNEVVKMRAEVKRIKVLLIRKLSRQISGLQKKKGNEAEMEKNRRRVTRLQEEIKELKAVAPDRVTKTALQKDLSFDKVCRDKDASLSDRATSRIATHPQFNKKIQTIKDAIKAFKAERMNARRIEKQQKNNAEDDALKDVSQVEGGSEYGLDSEKSSSEDDDIYHVADEQLKEKDDSLEDVTPETLNERKNSGHNEDKLAAKSSSESLYIPEEMIKMRKEVKRIRVVILGKMAEEIALLKKRKKEDSEEKESQKRAAAILKEMQALRLLKPDEVIVSALQENNELEKILQDPNANPGTRAIAHIAKHSNFVIKLQKAKERKAKADKAEKKKAERIGEGLPEMKTEDIESEDDGESENDGDYSEDDEDSEGEVVTVEEKGNGVKSGVEVPSTTSDLSALEKPPYKVNLMDPNVGSSHEKLITTPNIQSSTTDSRFSSSIPDIQISVPNVQLSSEAPSVAPSIYTFLEKPSIAPQMTSGAPDILRSPKKSLTAPDVHSSPKKYSSAPDIQRSVQSSTVQIVQLSSEESSVAPSIYTFPEKQSIALQVTSGAPDILKSPKTSLGAPDVHSSPKKSSSAPDIQRSHVKSSGGPVIQRFPKTTSGVLGSKGSLESSTASNVQNSNKSITVCKTEPKKKLVKVDKINLKSQKKDLPMASRVEAEESDLSDEEGEKEYFDDSTEERFHKQSSQSEDDDDDFFLGKVSKLKKRRNNKNTFAEKKGDLQKQETEITRKHQETRLGKLESVFCSTLSKAMVSSQKEKFNRNEGLKPPKFQNQWKGPHGQMKASQFKEPELEPDRKTGSFVPNKQTFKAVGQRKVEPSRAWRERSQMENRQKQTPRTAAAMSNPHQQTLHPSWEASKRRKEQQSQITAFQGKKIRFDDDE